MLPLALMGLFLIDISYFSIPSPMQALQQTLAQMGSVVYYLIFVNGLEFLLRILSPILDVIRSLWKSWLKH